jgi:hypothetical protein
VPGVRDKLEANGAIGRRSPDWQRPAYISPTCAMPKPPGHTGEAKSRDKDSVGKLRLYEILYNLNQGFEHSASCSNWPNSTLGTSGGKPSA